MPASRVGMANAFPGVKRLEERETEQEGATTMITNATAPKRDSDLGENSLVNYCGVLVEVFDRMEHCSLIRYRDRELVVDTEDLKEVSVLKHAA